MLSRRVIPTLSARRPFTTLRSTPQLRTSHPSSEPLAQKLNIDDPTSGDLRNKTQTAQAETENLTEPPTASNPAKERPTREPEAQRLDKDEPPPGGLRDLTQEQMAKSENTDST